MEEIERLNDCIEKLVEERHTYLKLIKDLKPFLSYLCRKCDEEAVKFKQRKGECRGTIHNPCDPDCEFITHVAPQKRKQKIIEVREKKRKRESARNANEEGAGDEKEEFKEEIKEEGRVEEGEGDAKEEDKEGAIEEIKEAIPLSFKEACTHKRNDGTLPYYTEVLKPRRGRPKHSKTEDTLAPDLEIGRKVGRPKKKKKGGRPNSEDQIAILQKKFRRATAYRWKTISKYFLLTSQHSILIEAMWTWMNSGKFHVNTAPSPFSFRLKMMKKAKSNKEKIICKHSLFEVPG